MGVAQPGENAGIGEPACARVQVVVTSHRPLRQPQVRVVWESFPDQAAQVFPYEWVGEFDFDLAG
jgi:hypothetical protein